MGEQMTPRPGFFSRFGAGFGFFFQGFREAYAGGRLKFSLTPLIINILMFIGMIWLIYGTDVLETFTATPEAWYWRALFWLLGWLIKLVLFYLTLILFPVIGAIVASPFLDLLTEKQEEEILGRPVAPPFTAIGMIGDILRATAHALKGLGLGTLCAGGLLLVNILPVIGSLIYIVLNACVAALFFSLQFMDYPLARRRLSYSAKLKALLHDTGGSLGLGMAIFLCAMIPVLNAVMLAPAACGATLLYHRIARDGAVPLNPLDDSVSKSNAP